MYVLFQVMEKIKESDLEQVSGGCRGRGGDVYTCPYCGCIVSAYDLNNHIYAAHTAGAYENGTNFD